MHRVKQPILFNLNQFPFFGPLTSIITHSWFWGAFGGFLFLFSFRFFGGDCSACFVFLQQFDSFLPVPGQFAYQYQALLLLETRGILTSEKTPPFAGKIRDNPTACKSG